jgi:hypothetical protein
MTTLATTTSLPRSRAAILPVGAFAAGVALVVAGLAVYWRGWPTPVPIGYGADLPALLSTELFALSATAVGCAVARRRPRSLVAWLMVLLGIGAAAIALGLYRGAAMAGAAVEPHLDVGGWLAGGAMQPVMGVLTGLLMFVFPDGRLASRAWRPAVVALVAGAALRFGELALAGEPVPYLPTLDNPVRLPGLPGDWLAASRAWSVGLALLLGSMALGALSLAARYRRADAEAKRQIRWFVFAGALVALTLAPLAHLFVAVDPAAGLGEDLWVLFFASASLYPIAVGIGITRYHLFEIDRFLSRTFVYGSLTAILAGLFTASVGLSQRLFVAFTGETSDLAIVLTTLVAASAYTPVRRRLEGLAERLFRYEEPRFGAYRASLREVLTLLDPEEGARRLVAEATRELGALGGWVELDVEPGGSTRSALGDPAAAVAGAVGGVALATGGARSDLPPGVVVPITGHDGPIGRLVLGARHDGSPYRPDDIRALEEVAALLGRCLDLRVPALPEGRDGDRPPRGAAGRGQPSRSAARPDARRALAERRPRRPQAPAASVPQAATMTP